MSEIVEWLREKALRWEEMHARPDVPIGLREAADEIERLRAALEDVSSTFDDTYSPYSREGRLGRLARAALAEEKPND